MWREPRRSQLLLGGYLITVFAVSAITDLRLLGAAWVMGLALLHRGALRCLRRVLLGVLPFTAALSLGGWLVQRLLGQPSPAWTWIAGLNLRATLIAFLTVAAARRINLCRALAFSTTLSRLLAVTQAQVHALRLLGRESSLGLKSRLLHRPRTTDVLRGAATITGTLVAIGARNARDTSDALRSRGI